MNDFLSHWWWLVSGCVTPPLTSPLTFPVFPSIPVGLCLHLVLAQALFFDLLKDNKITRRRKGSIGASERRTKKKAEYVCSSKRYSQTTKRRYNCRQSEEKMESEKYSTEISGKNSQPCYDDNK